MTARRLALATMIVAIAIGCAGCRSTKKGAVDAIGSTSIQPFAELLAQDFNKIDPNYYVEVQGGGSTAGLQAVSNRISEIGMCSRALKGEENDIYDANVIARDGLAVVIHSGNPVENLTVEQVRGLFSGGIRNWKEVGGLDLPVHVISREEGSGTREAFIKMVMHGGKVSRGSVTQESNGAVHELVKQDPAAVGYMSLGLVLGEFKGDLKPIRIDGIEATIANVISGKYKLVRPFLFVHAKGAALSPGARLFMNYILSPIGQQTLEREGLVRG